VGTGISGFQVVCALQMDGIRDKLWRRLPRLRGYSLNRLRRGLNQDSSEPVLQAGQYHFSGGLNPLFIDPFEHSILSLSQSAQDPVIVCLANIPPAPSDWKTIQSITFLNKFFWRRRFRTAQGFYFRPPARRNLSILIRLTKLSSALTKDSTLFNAR
jgi:hypothetical protein